MATDPVCGMFVEERGAELRLVRSNRTYYFCSTGCLRQFAAPEEERRGLRHRLTIAWPLSIAVVVLTYFLRFPSSSLALFAFAAVVQSYAGYPFYRGLRDAVIARVGNMDVLVAVGTTAAFVYSTVVLVLPGRLPPGLYFDASALIVTLILTGNYLELFTRERSGSALRSLSELLPRTVIVVRDGRREVLPAIEVRPGDRLDVLPGGRFVADGRLLTGRTTVDESILTGERVPVPKGPGDAVLAGSVNGDGSVQVEATNVGTDSFVGQIAALLTDAELSRVPIQRYADRIAEAFVPFVLALALLAAVAWAVVGGADATIAVLLFVSVVITACPCAFGIATPAALVVATGRASELGILFRGEDAVERTARVDLVLTDKTGTLNTEAPRVVEAALGVGSTLEEMLAVAAGLERHSEHALGRAVMEFAASRGVTPREFATAHAVPGGGVEGEAGHDRFTIVRGESPPDGSPSAETVRAWAAHARAAGLTFSVVRSAIGPLGALFFSVPVDPSVRRAVARLRALGVEVRMVTGDRPEPARRAAEEAGIEHVHAEVPPDGKIALVRDYQRAGRKVAFVGDGLNDAAALSAADAGMAVGTGTEVAREAGRVLLWRSGFEGVPAAIELARATVRKVRQNVYWALGYNAILLPVAAGALVPFFGFGVYAILPVTGALAMGLSSTSVVLNSLSLGFHGRSGASARIPQGVTPAVRSAAPPTS